MRAFPALVGLLVFAVASSDARAQLDCSSPSSCTTIKYGLGTMPEFSHGEVPFDLYLYDHEDFGTNVGGLSYTYVRRDPLDPQRCSSEQGFTQLPGQVFLREQTGCTPTSEGPKCAGGPNAGKSCHIGAASQFASVECPSSSCVESPGAGCRVEIPISDGGKTDPATSTEYWINSILTRAGVFDISAMTANAPGGSSGTKECALGPTPRKACNTDADCGAGGRCEACYATNIRQKPSMATRYLLPEYRRTALDLPPGATYLRWDKGVPRGAPGTDPALDLRITTSTAFRIHQDDAAICCNSPNPTLCTSASLPYSTYPVLYRSNCVSDQGITRFVNEDNIVPDWIFEAGAISRFFTDSDFELPGVQHGVCRDHRDIGCTRSGNECAAVGDTCDFREPGFRVQPQAIASRDANGDPNPTACGSSLVVLRGKPAAQCSILVRYPVDGDPGPDCGVFNYGIHHRMDLTCDGAIDQPDDRCPFLAERDQVADADGDCTGGVDADCRGNECECGDANLDGYVDVTDIVEMNLMIFGAKLRQRTADANSDLVTNVSDIVATNQEIFVPDSSSCRHITSIRCGNNVRNEGEACDNGATCVGGPTPGAACDASGVSTCGAGRCERLGGDGCNPACRVERGWTCTGNVGQPSVCAPS